MSPSVVRSPVLAGVGLVVMWSSGFVGAELSRRADADPLTTLGWRFTILAVLLVAVSVVRGARMPSAGSWRRHMLIGVLCQPIYLVAVFEGVAHGVPGGTAALIAALQPLLVATVAGPLLGERANKVMVLGMALGLIGVTIVVSGDLGVTGAPWWAFLLPTLGMLSLATGTVVERRIKPQEDMLQTITMQAVITAVVIGTAAAVTGHAVPPMQWSFWAAVVWLIALSSLGGYVLYVHVSRTQGATVVSTLLYLTPPTTMLWVFLMFGTPVHLLGFLGLAISGLGVWLVLRGRRRVASGRSDRRSVGVVSR
jgi:drug/metabolite transporter (DMT)-like permease